MLGIARWLQRRIMWYSGHGNAIFMNDNEDGHRQESSEEEYDNDFFDGGDDEVMSYQSEADEDHLEGSDNEGSNDLDYE